MLYRSPDGNRDASSGLLDVMRHLALNITVVSLFSFDIFMHKVILFVHKNVILEFHFCIFINYNKLKTIKKDFFRGQKHFFMYFCALFFMGIKQTNK